MRVTKHIAQEANHLFRACQVGGQLQPERVRKVVEEIGDAKPRDYLSTLGAFTRLVKLECSRLTALIESAQPLPQGSQAQVLTALTRTYGPAVNASFAHNPALIGGIRIQVGSDVYDGSIRGRLARLEQSF